MPKLKKTSSVEDQILIQGILKEYDSQRAELFIHLTQHHQALALTLGSISFGAPIFIGQIGAIPIHILIPFLYLLSFIYSVISIHTAQLQFNIDVIGYFITTELEPQINKIVSRFDPTQKLLQWEPFIRDLRRKPLVLISGGAGTVIKVIFMSLPSPIIIFVATYLFLNRAQNSISTFEVGFIWVFCSIGCAIYLISIIYWVFILRLEISDFQMVAKR